MKYIPLTAVVASVLAAGCTVNTSDRVVEKPDPAPATSTTTVYTR